MSNQQIAETIVKQLGGAGRLRAMVGAYNFIAIQNGLSFRIKNQKANYIKITLNGKDLYDLEVGRVRGANYKVVYEGEDLYNDMLKPAIEKATGMYLSLFKKGGNIFYKGLPIHKEHPSGLYTFFSEKKKRFIKSDDLTFLKKQIDKEGQMAKGGMAKKINVDLIEPNKTKVRYKYLGKEDVGIVQNITSNRTIPNKTTITLKINNRPIAIEDVIEIVSSKMAKGGKLKVNGEDFSFLLELSDKELSKRLDLVRKQKRINAKQYFSAKEKNENTTKIEQSGNQLDNQERAIIEARIRVNKMAKGGKMEELKDKYIVEIRVHDDEGDYTEENYEFDNKEDAFAFARRKGDVHEIYYYPKGTDSNPNRLWSNGGNISGFNYSIGGL